MNQPAIKALYASLRSATPSRGAGIPAVVFLLLLTSFAGLKAQTAITGIVTDYNGFWKSASGSINSVRPSNDHNLLAFTHNGIQYSTGVNDAVLSSNRQTFVPGDFWALPIQSISSAVNASTKIGVGEMFDGVHEGAGTPPANNLSQYLTDGVKGLNIGTCVANLPANNLTFFINNIRPECIGDGIPDIIVTQVADPSNLYDRYALTDVLGNTVGVSRDIVFPSIASTGNWTADFWNAEQNPMTCRGQYVATNRGIRLWAADLSEFGITSSNYQSVRRFTIRLSGDSDVAFVAYNRRTIALTTVLPVELHKFFANYSNGNTELGWSIGSEAAGDRYVVQRGTDTGQFTSIDSVEATMVGTVMTRYQVVDRNVSGGRHYYRLKMIDQDGQVTYSNTVMVNVPGSRDHVSIRVFPNPAVSMISLTFPPTAGATVAIFSASGSLLREQHLSKGISRYDLPLQQYQRGSYYAVWQSGPLKATQSFLVR